jgi:hypothetical protein
VKNDIDMFVFWLWPHYHWYTALLINDEPCLWKKIEAYERDFIVFHRVAISETHLGKACQKNY